MARRLKQSPLPNRIEPEQPLRSFLWRAAAPYDGVFLPGADTLPDQMLDYLGHCARVHVVMDGLCLVFKDPVTLDPECLGHALPLREMRGALASYDINASDITGGLHVILNGAHISADLNAAPVVDPLSFWDMSQCRAMPASAPRRKPISPWQTAKSEVQQKPELDAIAKAETIYGEVYASIETQPDPRPTSIGRQAGHWGLRIAATGLILLLTALVILLATGLAVTGVRMGPIGALFGTFLAVWILFRWFVPKDRAVGTGASAPGRAANGKGRAAPAPRGPGLLSRMWGWAIWNTRAGDGFRNKLQRHMDDVQRMIDQGEIDRALKNAISIAREQEKEEGKSAPLSALPKPRGSLDLDFSGVQWPTSSIITTSGLEGLAGQYRALAQQLFDAGDYKRAAFIYSELLDDARSAIRVLEDGGAYEDAAKLATVRRQPGADITRLWFLADHKEIALVMAKRYGAMELIANEAEKKDPDFATFVRRHWIDELVLAGDLVKAIQASAGRPDFAGIHTAIIQQAALAGLAGDPQVLGPATLHLDWPRAALLPEFRSDRTDATTLIARQLNKLLHDRDEQIGDLRHRLLDHLIRYRPADTQGELAPGERLPALTDRLIRAVLFFDAQHPGAPDIASLKKAATIYKLATLAVDLGQIRRNNKVSTPSSRKIVLPPGGPAVDPVWHALACTQGGTTLAAKTSGALVLIGREGEAQWTDYISDIAGLVPIGPGRLVLLVRGKAPSYQLSLLDIALHRYRDLGRIDLLTWHTQADAKGWLVQTREAVCHLDVPALIDQVPRIETLWSVKQIVPVRVCAFNQTPFVIRWATQRLGDGRPGLIEIWTMQLRTLDLTISIADPTHEETRQLYNTPLLWLPNGVFSRLTDQQAASKPAPPFRPRGHLSSYDTEKDLLSRARDFMNDLQRPATISGIDEERAFAIATGVGPDPSLQTHRPGGSKPAVLFGAGITQQAASANGQCLAMLDDQGRLIGADLTTLTAWTFNG